MKKSRERQVAPWEVTADMFLSEAEVDSLLQYLENQAAGADAPHHYDVCSAVGRNRRSQDRDSAAGGKPAG